MGSGPRRSPGPLRKGRARSAGGRRAGRGLPVPVDPLLLRPVPLADRYAKIEGARDCFHANARCSGCGTRARVCPAGKVRMAGGRPEWLDGFTCHICHACINHCPKGASQIKIEVCMRSCTGDNERYLHPHATADQIAAQR